MCQKYPNSLDKLAQKSEVPPIIGTLKTEWTSLGDSKMPSVLSQETTKNKSNVVCVLYHELEHLFAYCVN